MPHLTGRRNTTNEYASVLSNDIDMPGQWRETDQHPINFNIEHIPAVCNSILVTKQRQHVPSHSSAWRVIDFLCQTGNLSGGSIPQNSSSKLPLGPANNGASFAAQPKCTTHRQTCMARSDRRHMLLYWHQTLLHIKQHLGHSGSLQHYRGLLLSGSTACMRITQPATKHVHSHMKVLSDTFAAPHHASYLQAYAPPLLCCICCCRQSLRKVPVHHVWIQKQPVQTHNS